MAIDINYNTFEILVPKDFTTFIDFDPINGRERRELDLLVFLRAVNDLQDDEDDAWGPTALTNTAPQDLGTFVQGRSVLVNEPYFVTFEDGTYLVNLVGANTNLASRATVNSVAVVPNNSAGLVQVSSGGAGSISDQDKRDIADQVWSEPATEHNIGGTMGELLNNAAGGGIDPTVLADAVWDALGADHNVNESMGVFLKEILTKVTELHKIQQLDPNHEVTYTDSVITVDNIVINLSGNGEDITIAQRQ